MMPKFSARSLRNLETCHPDIQMVCRELIRHFDFTVIEGHRDRHKQDLMVDRGLSKLHWPHSKHNKTPSEAVDLIPYPIDWGDRERMTFFAGQVIATARHMMVEMRWGGDWDQDTELADNRFDDLVHFELS